jgi:hypothetical protein
LILESVWETLQNGKWESKVELKRASGADDDTLTQIINFLDRWQFIDMKRTPELLVRRKSGVISPIETLQILSSIGPETEVSQKPPNVIAERVACRRCGGRQLTPIEKNELECDMCHEKQWYTVEGAESLGNMDPEAAAPQATSSLLKRTLIRLGHPQKAFIANIPKATQYFWFRCTHCGETATDYPHGHSKRLTCPACRTSNQFW